MAFIRDRRHRERGSAATTERKTWKMWKDLVDADVDVDVVVIAAAVVDPVGFASQ